MSYTQLSEFEQCPRRFWIRRILGVRRIESSDAGESDPLRFGTALHAALTSGDDAKDSRRPKNGSEPIGRYFELPVGRVERLERAVRRYCDSDVARRARSGCDRAA